MPLANGKRCYPLTITDNHSRFILQCRALSTTTTDAVKPWFEWVFRQQGLPETLRTDNGAPFASVAAGGLSRLSKWWIQLGIRPERIRPAKPSENGRHERMHRSLKEAVMRPPARTLAAQQAAFRCLHGGVQRSTFPRSAGPSDTGQCATSPRRVPIRNDSRRWNTPAVSPSGGCVAPASSSGVAS